jgi:HEAT repeat protein
MGLFDIFKKKGSQGDKEELSWSLKRRIKKAHNKFTPAEERFGALQGLAEDGSGPAIQALIKRFTFYVEPGTTDEREKDYVYDVLVGLGPAIIPMLIESIKTSDSLQWQLRMYHDLADEQEVLDTLIEIIEGYDTEYEKNPQRKIQIIEALGDWMTDRVAAVLIKFLEDVDEEVRYQTVQSLVRQDPELTRDRLMDLSISEDSNRIRDYIVDGLIDREIPIKGYAQRKAFEDMLGEDKVVDKQGRIKRRPPKAR